MSIAALSRRSILKTSAATMAGLSMIQIAGPARAFQTPVGGTVIP